MERLRQSEWEAILKYLDDDGKSQQKPPCKFEGCEMPAHEDGQGYCSTHFRRKRMGL